MRAGPIRVLVVDDSAVIRKLVTEALQADEMIEVVGAARNGAVAVEKVAELAPDAVTMDVEMPVMNGIEAVKVIRRAHRRLPIIMFSTLTERGASATMDALYAGASDYVTKPSNVTGFQQALDNIREELVPKLKALTGRTGPPTPPAPPSGAPHGRGPHAPAGAPGPAVLPRQEAGRAPAAPVAAVRPPGPRPTAFRALLIGSSTGGPDALAKVLSALPAMLPVPILAVQHMPPLFTRLLAERLNAVCAFPVHEAEDGMEVVAGQMYLAAGGKHMEVLSRGGRVSLSLTEAPPENFCRPAVDVTFRTALAAYGNALLSVVLTGMGRDGEQGCRQIHAAGGTVFAQDEATSVVWGMPGAVTNAGVADKVLPLESVAGEISAALSRTPMPMPTGMPATGVPAASAPTTTMPLSGSR